MNPLVSIIVPVYNTETFVLRTLKSVSTQDYNNLEVIIIDDKSTDHSIQVIDNFIKQNSDTKKTFILLKNEENKGLSMTRNRGISISKGKYIYFLDSDDELASSNCISKFVNLITQHNAEVCIGETQQIKKNKLIKNSYHEIHVNESKLESNILGHYLKGQWAAIACNRLYKKEFLVKHNLQFYPKIINEDELWSFQIYFYASRICFLKEKTYNYYIGDNTQSITLSKKVDLKSHQTILLEELNLLSLHNIQYNNKPYSTHFRNQIIRILDNFPQSRKLWIQNFNNFKSKLSQYNIRFRLNGIATYYIHTKFPKYKNKNLRF